MNTRKVWIVTVVLVLVLAGIAAFPVSNFATRALSVALVLALWLLITALSWRFLVARVVHALLAIGVAVVLMAPGCGTDDAGLADSYATELVRYRGTRYVWGGENRLGIDCSGLVRSALINAAISRGVASANPSLVRFGLSLWWHDRTARELGEGFRGETVMVTTAPSINAAPPTELRVGDLAVTASGVHVLAYLGNGTWIEADPGALKVLEIQVPEPSNSWFNVPVKIVRWQVLSNAQRTR